MFPSSCTALASAHSGTHACARLSHCNSFTHNIGVGVSGQRAMCDTHGGHHHHSHSCALNKFSYFLTIGKKETYLWAQGLMPQPVNTLLLPLHHGCGSTTTVWCCVGVGGHRQWVMGTAMATGNE